MTKKRFYVFAAPTSVMYKRAAVNLAIKSTDPFVTLPTLPPS